LTAEGYAKKNPIMVEVFQELADKQTKDQEEPVT